MSRRSRRSEKIWSDLRTIDQKLFERLWVSSFSTNFIRAAYSRSSALFSYFISFDDTERHKADRMIQEKALFSPGWQDGLKSFYSLTTSNLIKEKSWSYDNNKTFNLDVVRDVTNVSALLTSRDIAHRSIFRLQLASVYWVSHQFGMPIKDSSKSPHGLFTPQELYLILSAFFISVFMNFDSTAGFKLSQAAQKAAPTLLTIIKGRLVQAKGVPTAVDDLARSLQDFFVGQNVEGLVMGKTAHEYYTRLLESGRPFDQLEASVQSTMTASVSNQGQGLLFRLHFRNQVELIAIVLQPLLTFSISSSTMRTLYTRMSSLRSFDSTLSKLIRRFSCAAAPHSSRRI